MGNQDSVRAGVEARRAVAEHPRRAVEAGFEKDGDPVLRRHVH